MKKNFKHLFAMVMAMAMVLSCPVMASAAELDDNPVSSQEIIVSDDAPTLAIVPNVTDYVDDGIMPCNTPFINESLSGMALNKVYKTDRDMPHDGYLVVKLDVTGKANIKVQVKSGIFTATVYEDTVENGTSWKISTNQLKQGENVVITITSLKNETSFTLTSWIE